MVKTQAKIKPYNSPPIPISGTTKCAVTFGYSSIPVEWHIIDNPCEPVLAGRIAEELGIIKFDAKPTVFQPVQMIHSTDNKETLQNILQTVPTKFRMLGEVEEPPSQATRRHQHQASHHTCQTSAIPPERTGHERNRKDD